MSCRPATPTGPTLYVAVSGSDSTGTGSSSQPFATIDGARAYIRSNGLNVNMQADITVLVGPGDYWETAVTLTDEDGSSTARAVRYRARDGVNTVRLLGGRRVSGWSLWSGSIYRIAVSGVEPWMMYENEVRGDLARFPKAIPNVSFPEAQEPNLVAPDNLLAYDRWDLFPYDAGDVDPSTWTLADVLLDERDGGREWWNGISPIASVDTGDEIFTTTQFLKYRYGGVAPGNKYFVKGDLSMLTQAGEWMFDRNDSHGAPGGGGHYLYYWPRNTPIEAQEIVIPTTKRVVSMVGADTSNPVRNVWLENITIQYSDFNSWYRYGEYGNSDNPNVPPPGKDPATAWYSYDGAMYPDHRQGAVYMENTEGCRIQGCRIANAGYSGIFGYVYNHGAVIRDNLIENVGANGIYWEGGWPGEGDIAFANYIRNNRIRHIGQLVLQGAGIWLTNTSRNYLGHNEISDGRRSGIFLGVAFTMPQADCYCKDNVIEYNYVHHVGQDSGDMGGIGMEGLGSRDAGPYNRNYFRQNWIDSIAAHPDMTDALPRGFFCDEETDGQVLDNIAMTNIASGSLFATHDSDDHVLTNVQGQPGYNSALVDFANIGLESGFPYA